MMSKEIHSELSEYLKPILEEIESVRVVPTEDIRESDKYMSDQSYINQHYLLIEASEDGGEMNFNRIHAELPDSLSNVIEFQIFTSPDESDIVAAINVAPDTLDSRSDRVELDPPKADNFEEILYTVKDDLEYLNDLEDPISFVGVGEESAVIDIHEDLLLDSNEYWSSIEYIGVYFYFNRSFLRCTHVYRYDEPYYRIRVTPYDKQLLRSTRKRLVQRNSRFLAFDCPECNSKETVVLGDREISYCTSCQKVFKKFTHNADLTKPLSETIEGDWINYTSDPLHTMDSFDEQEALTKTETGKEIYTYIFDDTREAANYIYMYLGGQRLWIPVKTGEKTIPTIHPSEHTDIEKNIVCYNCSQKSDQEYFYIDNIWIQDVESTLFEDSVYVCKDCKDSMDSELEEMLDNVSDLNVKLAARNI